MCACGGNCDRGTGQQLRSSVDTMVAVLGHISLIHLGQRHAARRGQESAQSVWRSAWCGGGGTGRNKMAVQAHVNSEDDRALLLFGNFS